MSRMISLMALVCLTTALGEAAVVAGPPPSLSGAVTDPSGASIPNAGVEIRGPGGARRTRTAGDGQYSFPSLGAGTYSIRIGASGFSPTKGKLRIDHAVVFDARLAIRTGKQMVNVEGANAGLAAEPDANRSAVILGPRQLPVLSDDPDELAQQLQVLAGPAPGPGGGQMYIDGFLGGNLPPKSAIREIRINANPFSPEYDQPGFGRIEIFTKPGSDSWHGEALAQYNNQLLDARNPLLAQPAPPYQAQLYRLSAGGPLKTNRSSLTFDVERRQIAGERTDPRHYA